MKNSEMFEICHSRYRVLRDQLNEDGAQLRPVALEKPADGYMWRPTRARACEYVADFERIGRHALRRREWKGRLKLFETYFVSGLDYRRAIGAVGVADGTFDYWFREVKRTVGAEFSRTGLFPPSQYFEARNWRPSAAVKRHDKASGWSEPSRSEAEEREERGPAPCDSATGKVFVPANGPGANLSSTA
jgi:hypothetical protein